MNGLRPITRRKKSNGVSEKKYATYTLEGAKIEQGWIYGFSEPYQIFILYMILEKEGANDHEDIKKILESFEVFGK